MDCNSELSDVDDFDEWEDVNIELEDYQYIIEYAADHDKIQNTSSQLVKLTKMFKKDYVERCFKFHQIQANFSIWHFKMLILNNLYKDTKIKSVLPNLIRKKFKHQIKDFNRLQTLIKGFSYWFQKNYKINVPGQRPVDQKVVRDLVFKHWFEENEDKLKEFHRNKKINFQLLKHHYEEISNSLCITVENFGYFPKAYIDLKVMKTNTKEEYLLKFYLILKELLLPNTHVNIKLVYNVPCVNIKKVINDCATKTLTSIIKETFLEDNSSGIQKSVDYDLYYPYFWLELHFEDKIFYLNPLNFGDLTSCMCQISLNNPFEKFFEFDKISPFHVECPFYIFSVDSALNVEDVSFRYIPNLQYTVKPCLINLKNETLWKANKDFWKVFKIVFKDFDIKNESPKEALLSYKKLPQDLKSYKRHPNFIVDNFSCYRKLLEVPVGDSVGQLVHNQRVHNVYLRSQLQRLRTKSHWQVLGRDIIETEPPRSYKTFRDRKTPRHSKNTVSQYTFDQTIITPRIKEMPTLNSYRQVLKGNEMLKIFNEHTMLPHGYKLLANNDDKGNRINRSLVRTFNKKNFRKAVDCLEVITGFKFLPKNQVKPITKFMVAERDYGELKKFRKLLDNVEQLNHWNELLLRLHIKQRISQDIGFSDP